MATPNYGFEKRQRELAKKKKKEEKLRAKAAGKRQEGSETPGGQDEPGTQGDAAPQADNSGNAG